MKGAQRYQTRIVKKEESQPISRELTNNFWKKNERNITRMKLAKFPKEMDHLASLKSYLEELRIQPYVKIELLCINNIRINTIFSRLYIFNFCFVTHHSWKWTDITAGNAFDRGR